MPTTRYTITAKMPKHKTLQTVVFTNSIANYWVKFYEFLGYTVTKEEKDLTF